MTQISSAADLGAAVREAEVEVLRERLEHDCWAVCQRWGKDKSHVEPELYGPFTSIIDAMAERDRLHAESVKATQWIEMYGEPTTTVVPIRKPGT